MAKLGYTWYPKDWKTNEKVFNMSLELRGFYRELIDFSYENDNNFEINEKYFVRMLGISSIKLNKLLVELLATNVIKKEGNYYSIPTVEPRIQLIRGGRKSKPTPKPTPEPIRKPTPKQRERESKREIESESKDYLNLTKFVNRDKLTEDQKRDRMNALHDELKNSQIWLTDVARVTHTKESDTWTTVKIFLDELKAKDDFYKSISEVKKHCINWIRKHKPAL